MVEHFINPGHPNFNDLPWDVPVLKWSEALVEDLPRGLSRHPVVFVKKNGGVYAIKEMPPGLAKKEFQLLMKMQAIRLPVVTAVGYLEGMGANRGHGALITRYLNHSLPYRSLFMSNSLVRYRESLLDAIAGLLVQLHLAGVYWGDCSLSNTLFRRDAGALQAYLVDAETALTYDDIPAAQRYDDLVIMEETIDGDLADLSSLNLLAEGIPISHTGAYIRQRYQRLWEEITREQLIDPNERYRIQERIKALNDLGFSVGDVELTETGSGEQLRLRVVVTDRNFHFDQLRNLTGIEAQERQARQMMNEIQWLKATLSSRENRSLPLSTAAQHWLENYYRPAVNQFISAGIRDAERDAAELYCQVLEHKWFLSERARHDVGHEAAINDYLKRFAPKQAA